MGYGISSPGIWNGKRHFTWKVAEGEAPANLETAMAAWEKAAGITFTKCVGPNAEADFKVKTGQMQSSWGEAQRTLSFKELPTVGTALHEIGHLLGLSHEHDRSDSRVAFYEADTARGGFGLKGAVIRSAKLVEYGGYDNASIMQYPESNYAAKTEPSAGDTSTVKTINGW